MNDLARGRLFTCGLTQQRLLKSEVHS